MNLLRTLARTQHKAILVATHELDLALQTADLIWLATPDKKIKVGIPEDLVLDGSLDEVFQFKGFDLKTGKINHEPHQDIAIALTGSGPELLWTKNALERNGFEISENGKIKVVIESDKSLVWKIGEIKFATLKDLLEWLKK
jgi:iron complex transport system ATP-binding protein